MLAVVLLAGCAPLPIVVSASSSSTAAVSLGALGLVVIAVSSGELEALTKGESTDAPPGARRP